MCNCDKYAFGTKSFGQSGHYLAHHAKFFIACAFTRPSRTRTQRITTQRSRAGCATRYRRVAQRERDVNNPVMRAPHRCKCGARASATRCSRLKFFAVNDSPRTITAHLVNARRDPCSATRGHAPREKRRAKNVVRRTARQERRAVTRKPDHRCDGPVS